VSQRRAAWNRKFDRLERLVAGMDDDAGGGR
jgi:hypothetical protein